jgi:YNFM family putative membrane transporter
VVGGLVALVTGLFTAQAVLPAFVDRAARRARGGANALPCERPETGVP